ncbi:TPA: hypothetical protein N0F65_012070 [Lagenidium giganteum]|uniref:CFA20 domain-containing protein n=1 Tax=Lagenidium giganteum TaxID=4803 RepID=A0AAV2YK71_9STRA|nr:TPA: hypothetical protein N0F65_012070 [Lagenidium giganteum]
MFAQTYHPGLLSLLYSVGSKPLQLWEKCEEAPGASVRRVLDDAVQSSVIELRASNISATWIRSPASPGASLHIRSRHLVLLLKPSSDEPVSIEVAVQDSRQALRRFRVSTFQRSAHVHELLTVLPLQLERGWNQLQLDLAQLTREAYQTQYAHTVSVQVHANCRLRRIFFADHLPQEHERPPEFRLFQRLSRDQVRELRASGDRPRPRTAVNSLRTDE